MGRRGCGHIWMSSRVAAVGPGDTYQCEGEEAKPYNYLTTSARVKGIRPIGTCQDMQATHHLITHKQAL